MPCAVSHVCAGDIDPSHIQSRGAGGPDTVGNVIPLCRNLHNEWHRVGARPFYIKWKPLIRAYARERIERYLVWRGLIAKGAA